MKICTDENQSLELIKLGLDKNTADMHYFSDGYNPTKLEFGFNYSNFKFYRGTEYKYVPAWSLTSLLYLINANSWRPFLFYCDSEPVDVAFKKLVSILKK